MRHGCRSGSEMTGDCCRLVRENTETATELARREEQEAAERLRARAAVRNALSKQVRLHDILCPLSSFFNVTHCQQRSVPCSAAASIHLPCGDLQGWLSFPMHLHSQHLAACLLMHPPQHCVTTRSFPVRGLTTCFLLTAAGSVRYEIAMR